MIDASGKVGIGTASPTNLLTIHAGTSTDGDVTVLRLNNDESALADGDGVSMMFGLGTDFRDAGKIGVFSSDASHDQYNMRFSVRNAANTITEYMRIVGATGNVGIGDFSSAWKLAVAGESTGTSAGIAHFINTHSTVVAGDEVVRIQFSGDDDCTGGHFVNFYDSGGDIGRINCAGASSVAYATSSDYRLKMNQVALTDGLSKIMLLKPYRFNWKKEPEADKQEGFFAHEVQELIPVAVDGVKDAVDDDGKIIKQTMDMTFIVPSMVSAIQELSAKLKKHGIT